MAKLMDQPGVSELVAKEVAKAVKATKAESVRIVKAAMIDCTNATNDKVLVKTLKGLSGAIVSAVKA